MPFPKTSIDFVTDNFAYSDVATTRGTTWPGIGGTIRLEKLAPENRGFGSYTARRLTEKSAVDQSKSG